MKEACFFSMLVTHIVASDVFNSSHFLLVTDSRNGTIYAIDVNSQSYATIPLLTHEPYSIDYDYSSNKIFYAEHPGQIKSAGLDGSDEKIFLQLGWETELIDLALDIPLQLIFYTDARNGDIVVMTMDGAVSLVIINETLDKPNGIVTDPIHGMLYWTNKGTNATLEKASYDGTSRDVIINTGLRLPNGLAVDVPGNKIYWCDGWMGLIESANLDGSSRQVLLKEEHYTIYMVLALDHDTLYFTDMIRSNIMKIQTDGTGLQSFGPSAFDHLLDIHVYNTGQANYDGSNACSNGNGGCSHMCLPKSPNGRTCVCPNGKASKPNGVLCEAKTAVNPGDVPFPAIAGGVGAAVVIMVIVVVVVVIKRARRKQSSIPQSD